MEEKELLTLIHYITTFGLQCHVDLLCQVEINTMGGLPNWIPTKILNVKKIMVYLTNKYVKVNKFLSFQFHLKFILLYRARIREKFES